MRHGMRVVTLVQARLGSTRLPGKALLPIAGHPLLWHVLERAKRAKRPAATVLVTTTEPEDRALAEVATGLGVPTYFGSTEDVLDRYYQGAKAHGADVVVRLTGDSPLLEPALVDRVVDEFLAGDADYASNSYPVATFPDGLDVEVCSFEALERAWKEARLASEREHVMPYIWKHPERFRLHSVAAASDRSALRWTVDEEADLAFVRAVYDRLWQGEAAPFGQEDVLALLEREPDLVALNGDITRNEGYYKSLSKEARGLEQL